MRICEGPSRNLQGRACSKRLGSYDEEDLGADHIVLSTSVRQRRTTRPRDLPYGEEALLVRWHKTQWTCRERACARTAFTDQVAELPAGARVTGRLRRHVAGRVADGLAVSAAGGTLLGWPISHAPPHPSGPATARRIRRATGSQSCG